MASQTPFLEFGFCGIDHSVPAETLQQLFGPPVDGPAKFVAAFQLAYQGFPWKPTEDYAKGAPLEKRRYGGLVYPAWDEIDQYMKDLPAETPLSFHLNQTPKCPYVSSLLDREAELHSEMLKLVGSLVKDYKARHIQINLTAMGVPMGLFAPVGSEQEAGAEAAADVIRKLCEAYPGTAFVVPIAQITQPDKSVVDTLPFFGRLTKAPVPPNLCGFFDSSAGTGKEADAVPELPPNYPTNVDQRVGFTGGLHSENVKEWLSRYEKSARQHGCLLLSDCQSGFRQNRKRGEPADPVELLKIGAAVREWVAALK